MNIINIALAAEQTTAGLVAKINANILNPIIGFMFALAVFVFMYGTIEFMSGTGNDTKKKEGKSHMIWGVIGMVIMLSAFGIVRKICIFVEAGC